MRPMRPRKQRARIRDLQSFQLQNTVETMSSEAELPWNTLQDLQSMRPASWWEA
jgi:hypothetical protein